MKIPKDKLLHFGAGAIIGLSAFVIDLWAVVPLALAAVGKEVWDAHGHGTPETMDAIVTLISGLIVIGIIILN